MPNFRLAVAQTNPTVGDFERNSQEILDRVTEAAGHGANLVVFGEMSLSGYPIEDLSQRPEFLADATTALTSLAEKLDSMGFGDVAVLVGSPRQVRKQASSGPHPWSIAQNTAALLLRGGIAGSYAKHHLPNYSVFDEYRNFVPGDELLTFELNGIRFSTLICEDIWQQGGPVSKLSESKTDVTLVLNGSPFELEKVDRRVELARELAITHKTHVVYANLFGGQDDLVFDGNSFVVSSSGSLIAEGASFATDLLLIDIDATGNLSPVSESSAKSTSDKHAIWQALVLGLRDYVYKNGFKSIILGLSGGIDSAVCATIAKDALGADAVFGVLMPSKFSSDGSIKDAEDLAARLGIHSRIESIERTFERFQDQFSLDGLAAENLQARIRGLILMALSNAEGHLTLTTGNKTELAVGYSTIYGDSVGGFAPIKDVPKSLVWELAKWRNALSRQIGELEPIPENSINKPPSAELRPDQVDQDSLPDYYVLDSILESYVNQRLSVSEIARQGFDFETVAKVASLVDRSEWKRRQGAIGPKISGMAFGRDRRLPITSRFRSH